MIFVDIDDTNIEDFADVLPQDYIDGLGISIGAVEGDTACGAISLSFDGANYHIDWIFVTASMRLRGIGRGLIHEARAPVTEVGLFTMLMQLDASDDSGLYPFILSVADEEGPIELTYSHDRYVITRDDFLASPAVGKLIQMPKLADFKPGYFWNMKEEERKEAFSLITKDFSVVDEESFERSCEKKLCLVGKRKDKTETFVLVQRDDADLLTLSYLYSSDPKALACMFQMLYALLEKYESSLTINFEPINKQSRLLADKLFSNAKREAVYEAEFL